MKQFGVIPDRDYDRLRGKPSRPSVFLAGWIFGLALWSLLIDWYGKERYLELVQIHFVDPSVTVPWAIAGLIVAWALLGLPGLRHR